MPGPPPCAPDPASPYSSAPSRSLHNRLARPRPSRYLPPPRQRLHHDFCAGARRDCAWHWFAAAWLGRKRSCARPARAADRPAWASGRVWLTVPYFAELKSTAPPRCQTECPKGDPAGSPFGRPRKLFGQPQSPQKNAKYQSRPGDLSSWLYEVGQVLGALWRDVRGRASRKQREPRRGRTSKAPRCPARRRWTGHAAQNKVPGTWHTSEELPKRRRSAGRPPYCKVLENTNLSFCQSTGTTSLGPNFPSSIRRATGFSMCC